MATFWEDQLAAAQAQLVQVQAAILVVLQKGTSYSLDSGQTRQSVTRSTLGELKNLQKELLEQIQGLEARLGRCGTVVVRPGF